MTLSLKWPANNCHLIETMKSEARESEVRAERESRQTTKERQTERWSIFEVVTIWICSWSEAVETQDIVSIVTCDCKWRRLDFLMVQKISSFFNWLHIRGLSMMTRMCVSTAYPFSLMHTLHTWVKEVEGVHVRLLCREKQQCFSWWKDGCLRGCGGDRWLFLLHSAGHPQGEIMQCVLFDWFFLLIVYANVESRRRNECRMVWFRRLYASKKRQKKRFGILKAAEHLLVRFDYHWMYMAAALWNFQWITSSCAIFRFRPTMLELLGMNWPFVGDEKDETFQLERLSCQG